MNNFFELIETRESCRNYTGDSIEKEKLIKCIEAARLAPSACNGQPWQFYLVTNSDIKSKLVKLTQSSSKNASAFIVILEEKPKLQTKIVNNLKNQEYTQVDIGIAASHVCLAATELGLSTCMLGWFNEDKIKELLNISPSKRIRLIISVGYSSNKEPSKKNRKSLDKILNIID
ncbi:nitroreductase family protein [Clostridium sardiniense]|uniref:nitroreductase family protein n=1 Tax=Clostridium sardiniense TaxID=29369 RepID=UPI003D32C30A